MKSLMETWTESRTQAHENIRDEQQQQKCVFDNNVERNRYGLIIVVIIQMLLNDYNILLEQKPNKAAIFLCVIYAMKRNCLEQRGE